MYDDSSTLCASQRSPSPSFRDWTSSFVAAGVLRKRIVLKYGLPSERPQRALDRQQWLDRIVLPKS
jgi:hypothetical protein